MSGNGGILTTNAQPLNSLEVAGNTTLGSNLVLTGNVVIDSGITMDTTGLNYSMTVGGNWTNSGVYTGNTSVVTLNGNGDQSIAGSNTFYQLTASATGSSRTLTFANGTTQTITDSLTLTGLNGNTLLLRSDAPTHQWSITPDGLRTVDHVDVQDSYNTVSVTPIVATNSVDSGNNANWSISVSPLTVSAQAASSITKTTATLNGTITATGGLNATERGFRLYIGNSCAGSVNQTLKDTGGSYGTGAYSKIATGLSSNTAYSYTAYAINASGTSTSACQSFATLGDVYYIVSGTSAWVRGAISDTKDIAQLYTLVTTNNQNLNFGSAYIIASSTANSISSYQAGASLGSNGGDDSTPINTANAGYIMSDHGLNSPVVTSVGHDKTSADIGSAWTDGTDQYVLASISGNALTFYSVPSGSPWTYRTSVRGALTHVSGATHTSSITVTSQTAAQQFPVVKNVVRRVLADGVTDVIGGGQGYANYVDLIEEYDLIDPSTINTTNNPFIWNDATGIWMHVKNVFHVTAGTTVVHSTYTIERPMNVGYFGIIQVGPMTAAAYDHQYYYIPKTKPISSYDFSAPQLFDSPPASTLSFNNSYVTDTSKPPDRQIIFLKRTADSNYDIGFAFGYSPYGDTASSKRSVNASSNYWWIYTSKKTYPEMVNGAQVGIINNTTYDAYAYRQWIDSSQYDIGKSVYWNNLNDHELVYVDYWRSASNDVTTLPLKYAGYHVSVIESDNVVPIETVVSPDGELTLSTTGSSTKGYAVLELTPPSTNIGVWGGSKRYSMTANINNAVTSGGGNSNSPESNNGTSDDSLIAELQTKIQELIAKINAVKLQGRTVSLPASALTEPLFYGSTGSQVVLLQTILQQQGFFPKEANRNGKFGPATLNAVRAFQAQYKIATAGSAGYGLVGPKTRAVLNQLAK